MDTSLVALSVLLVSACVIDLRTRRIPNLLVGFGMCLGFGLAWSSMGPAGLWFALKGVAIGFALFLPLFLLRAFGAGDVKLMMAVGSLVGVEDTLTIAMLSLVASGVLALACSIGMKQFPGMIANLKSTVFALATRDFELASGIAQNSAWRVPFAVPLLAGAAVWLFYFY